MRNTANRELPDAGDENGRESQRRRPRPRICGGSVGNSAPASDAGSAGGSAAAFAEEAFSPGPDAGGGSRFRSGSAAGRPDGDPDPDRTEARIALLARCVTPERLAKLERTAGMRTRYMTVVAENTFHSQNAAALVRHCEAFGLQRMHTVETLCPFQPSADVVRGTDKWVDIERHGTTAGALASLRAEGFRIVATTPHRRSCTPETFDVAAGPFALVFGTEHAGVSDEIAAAADEFLCIPMCGMVESLNVSASAAIVIYQLSARMRAQADCWRLTPAEQRELVLRWLRSTVRDADEMLRKAGLHGCG